MSDDRFHLSTRLAVLESQLQFLMNSMRMKAMIQTGLIDPATNQPVVKVVDGTLYEQWQRWKDGTSELPIAPPSADLPN